MNPFIFILIFGFFKPGENSFTFLKNLKDAQDIAMGEASVSLPPDVLSFLSNPSVLAEIKKYEFSFYSAFLWNNIKEEFVAYGGKTSYFGYCLSLNYLNYGEIQGRDTFGFKTQSFIPYDFAVHFGLGKDISKFLKMGIALGFASEKIEKETGNSFLFSFGTNYILPKNPSFKFSFSFLNLGTKVKFMDESFFPPYVLKFGIFYHKLKTPYFFSGELCFPFDDIPYFSLGIAYNIMNILEIRSGFKSSFDTGFLSSLRFGFGLNFSFLNIDYAIVPQGVLGFTHHVDLKFRF
jgi:hypothetical protein